MGGTVMRIARKDAEDALKVAKKDTNEKSDASITHTPEVVATGVYAAPQWRPEPGDIVLTKFGKDKELYDKKRAKILKVLSRTCRVLMEEGAVNEERDFKTDSLTFLERPNSATAEQVAPAEAAAGAGNAPSPQDTAVAIFGDLPPLD